MKLYEIPPGGSVPRTTGVYPNVASVADLAPGSKDGTPLHKAWVDDLFGAFQAVLNGASMTPDGVAETCGATPGDVTGSQFVEALQLILAIPGEIVGLLTNTIPTGARLLKLEGDAVSLADYPRLINVWCENQTPPVGNGTATCFYRCTNPANPPGSRAPGGEYLLLPDGRGAFLRGKATGAGQHDPDWATREFGDEQASLAQVSSHRHTGLENAGGTDYGIGASVTVDTVGGGATKNIYPWDTPGGTARTELASDANETRPLNTPVMWCIRY